MGFFKTILVVSVVLIHNKFPPFAAGQENVLDIIPEASEEEIIEGLIGIEDQINRDIEEHSLQINYLKSAESALANDNAVENKESQLEQLEALESLQEEAIDNERTYLEEIETEIVDAQRDVGAATSETLSYSLGAIFVSKFFSIAALLLSIGIAAFVANQAHHALLKRRQGYTSLNPYEEQDIEPI
jgi:Fe2+ transport system protein B